MDDQAQTLEMNMELTDIPGTSLKVSPVAIGTWAIGGWMWGGTDEAESIATIRAALEHGINAIDTAPVYGFGRSEEIVGKAIAESRLRSAWLSPRRPDSMGGRQGISQRQPRPHHARGRGFVAPAPNRLYRRLSGPLA